MNKLLQALQSMDPEEALTALAAAMQSLLPSLDEEARLRFLLDLVGERRGDKVSSMVHL
jgi:hypothetical protein